jgi:hypothetical protein
MPTDAAHVRTSSDTAGQRRIRRRLKSWWRAIANRVRRRARETIGVRRSGRRWLVLIRHVVVATEMDRKRAVVHVWIVWMSMHAINGS